ncbi:MAG TPA: TonB-dependent receptor [Blastocatellia bacterium]|nr:TonB-dependent receptor [Blastocatellia bacterium]
MAKQKNIVICEVLRLVVIALWLAVWCVCALAQQGSELAGRVTDSRQSVVANALVRAFNTTSGQIFNTETDKSGNYRIGGLPDGTYRVSALSTGFTTASSVVKLQGSGKTQQDFVLVPGAIAETLVVAAGKGSARAAMDTPQVVTVTGAAEMELRRPNSTLSALELTPNLTAISSNPAGERPRLRGMTSNRLLILVDGERLNNMRTDPFSGLAPSILDVNQLQAAEVVSGAGSSLYGSDALGGTINLVTHTPERAASGQYLSFRLDGDLRNNGPFRRGTTTLSWSGQHAAVRVSGSLFRTGNYHSGGSAISLPEVVRLGNFATEMGNAIGNNVALTYGVWNLPANGEIANSQAHGFNDQVDIWLFPSSRHSLRARGLNSQHHNLGLPLLTPPFDGRNQYNGFRRLDKNGINYEGRELANWLPRIAASFYRQKYVFSDDNLVSAINEGSSWAIINNPASPTGKQTVLTGQSSAFSRSNFTAGKSAVTSYGFDVQASVLPWRGTVLTSGFGYLRDQSADEFSRQDFQPGATPITGRATNPDAVYRNLGWFNLIEIEARSWLRLTGGLRLDNWQTSARVTPGFPLSTESLLLNLSWSKLLANPGQINLQGLQGLNSLAEGTQGIGTSRTVATGNGSIILRLPRRIHPYLRISNSYREPGITERYLFRNFGSRTFSVLLVGNTSLRPERGRSIEGGLKAQGDRWRASAGYFRQELTDFLRLSFGNALFVAANPARGLDPVSPSLPLHGILFAQRANAARARIQGVEAEYEASLALHHVLPGLGRGTLTPFGTVGWLKGSDLSPDPKALELIRRFYGRSDTPIALQGSADDAPLPGISPFRGVFGVRYSSPTATWISEYQARYQARVKRSDPLDLATDIATQYGTLASLNSFAKHSLRIGYSHRWERSRVLVTGGIENLTNRLYFDHFQNAPAPGRSFVFGLTLELTKALTGR